MLWRRVEFLCQRHCALYYAAAIFEWCALPLYCRQVYTIIILLTININRSTVIAIVIIVSGSG